MAWWVILLIVLGSIVGAILLLFVILFIVYMTNADSKLLAFIQKKLNKVYDKRKRNRHLE
jgi:hypothetical protein